MAAVDEQTSAALDEGGQACLRVVIEQSSRSDEETSGVRAVPDNRLLRHEHLVRGSGVGQEVGRLNLQVTAVGVQNGVGHRSAGQDAPLIVGAGHRNIVRANGYRRIRIPDAAAAIGVKPQWSKEVLEFVVGRGLYGGRRVQRRVELGVPALRRPSEGSGSGESGHAAGGSLEEALTGVVVVDVEPVAFTQEGRGAEAPYVVVYLPVDTANVAGRIERIDRHVADDQVQVEVARLIAWGLPYGGIDAVAALLALGFVAAGGDRSVVPHSKPEAALRVVIPASAEVVLIVIRRVGDAGHRVLIVEARYIHIPAGPVVGKRTELELGVQRQASRFAI